MSLSFLNSISSPPQINPVFCSSVFTLYHFHSPSFSSLYHRKEGYRNGKVIKEFGILGDWKGKERMFKSGSMGRNKGGFFWISSLCRSIGNSSCGSSRGEEYESEEEEEEGEEEEEVGAESSCVLPDRWDVLGLGQAMVYFLSPIFFF